MWRKLVVSPPFHLMKVSYHSVLFLCLYCAFCRILLFFLSNKCTIYINNICFLKQILLIYIAYLLDKYNKKNSFFIYIGLYIYIYIYGMMDKVQKSINFHPPNWNMRLFLQITELFLRYFWQEKFARIIKTNTLKMVSLNMKMKASEQLEYYSKIITRTVKTTHKS